MSETKDGRHSAAQNVKWSFWETSVPLIYVLGFAFCPFFCSDGNFFHFDEIKRFSSFSSFQHLGGIASLCMRRWTVLFAPSTLITTPGTCSDCGFRGQVTPHPPGGGRLLPWGVPWTSLSPSWRHLSANVPWWHFWLWHYGTLTDIVGFLGCRIISPTLPFKTPFVIRFSLLISSLFHGYTFSGLHVTIKIHIDVSLILKRQVIFFLQSFECFPFLFSPHLFLFHYLEFQRKSHNAMVAIFFVQI